MKKFFSGLLVGLMISIPFVAHGEAIIQSLIGKSVEGEFPVKINGVQLDQPAAVIDGTSYLPLRAIGESLNKEVTFNENSGIELKEKNGVSQMEKSTPLKSKEKQLDRLETLIEGKKYSIRGTKQMLGMAQENSKISIPSVQEEAKTEVLKYQELLKKYEAELADLENQKAELSK